nr:PREDICTED: ecto-ADP-ribosyltransferase 5-like [Paralichthys olivaceus]
MASKMLISVPLHLLLCWMLLVASKTITIITLQDAILSIPLNMSPDSVDDMYSGCRSRMERIVNTKYFEKENKGIFADVWEKANECATVKFRAKNNKYGALTKNHIQAICVFTSNYEKFYMTFNDAVRTNRAIYGTSFPFHFLHFWLTTAVQILGERTGCKTTYRRTTAVFTGEVKQKIRFGSFSSTSASPNLKGFGNKTCFQIRTCYGAPLKNYSIFSFEEEVLIPPYEIFQITKKIKKNYRKLRDCENVYILKSVRFHSNLNCKNA